MKKYRNILIIGFLGFLISATPGKKMSKQELKIKLTPLQYQITQENGTEKPFVNEYWNNKKQGIYVDIVSGEVLFNSRDKFDSGTGWPSFTRVLVKENIKVLADDSLFMKRTEVRSSGASSHLGHIFDDGPGPTGKRYCINSASMRFIPTENLKKEGYEKYLSLFNQSNGKIMEASFGAGCFWGVEEIFRKVKGVIDTEVGYMGGSLENPTYQDITSGNTGHAEVIHIKYDSSIVSYAKLLGYFWRLHDPTTKNRQGVDIGSQYRSVIFTYSEEQTKAALKSKKEFDESKVFQKKAVTEITPTKVFYKAENYHQDYYQKNNRPVCHTLRAK